MEEVRVDMLLPVLCSSDSVSDSIHLSIVNLACVRAMASGKFMRTGSGAF